MTDNNLIERDEGDELTLLRSVADHLQLDCVARAADRIEALSTELAVSKLHAEYLIKSGARLSTECEALREALAGLADVVEHDCDCPPCVGSMAPAEHFLGLARQLLNPNKDSDHGGQEGER